MNIHEHQAKAVLAEFGVAVPRGYPAFSVDEAVQAAEKLGGPVAPEAWKGGLPIAYHLGGADVTIEITTPSGLLGTATEPPAKHIPVEPGSYASAVVILLMWFLLSSYAVLLGAEFNAEMERQTRKDTTAGGDNDRADVWFMKLDTESNIKWGGRVGGTGEGGSD